MTVTMDVRAHASIGLVASFGVLLVACGEAVAPDPRPQTELRPGAVLLESDAFLVVPDTVEAGSPFVVKVTTFGDGCTRKGVTELTVVSENHIRVAPMDLVTTGTGCLAILVTPEHTAELVFSEPGLGLVTIRVRDPRTDEVVDLRREVVVR